MQKVIWKLDEYYINQYNENPQLFETNLYEMFPRMNDYQILPFDVGIYAVINMKEANNV